jgi:hypothetical protein
MTDDPVNRKVAKRNEVNQAMIDAAHVMPGNADKEQPSDPEETPEAAAAETAVTGRPGAPGKLPGTTFGRGR